MVKRAAVAAGSSVMASAGAEVKGPRATPNEKAAHEITRRLIAGAQIVLERPPASRIDRFEDN
jgi:hypothetical protein